MGVTTSPVQRRELPVRGCVPAAAPALEMFGPFVGVLDGLCTDDTRLAQTVSLFYHSMAAYPATLTLGGFTKIGRPLFTSVLSATVTYIVIMLQFQQSDSTVVESTVQNTSDTYSRNTEVQTYILKSSCHSPVTVLQVPPAACTAPDLPVPCQQMTTTPLWLS
ncbi:uncharacterized protein LOC113218211 isoform X2 [Frankliniella occidentalis]|uniref:Uncharacterized protein LOC113218211 isoform X2 n=1 Tax=Frankliniella occidentalis TaxID=133901 RepID=A0A9C6X0U4_FRAOC|nr:uncharacterized protein LOC113218211 isoform X2 [Frankliniella occidentalis]